jgi:hypothetical protein
MAIPRQRPPAKWRSRPRREACLDKRLRRECHGEGLSSYLDEVDTIVERFTPGGVVILDRPVHSPSVGDQSRQNPCSRRRTSGPPTAS